MIDVFIKNFPSVCEYLQENCEDEGKSQDSCKAEHTECIKHMEALKQYVKDCDN